MAAFKKVALMVLGTAMQTYGQKLNDEQEVLGYAADIMIDTYAAESAVLRARAATVTRPAPRRAPRGRRAVLRQRRGPARGACRAQRPGGDGRRRYAADASGSAAPGSENHSGQHRGAAAAACGRDRRQGTVYFRLMTQRVLLVALALVLAVRLLVRPIGARRCGLCGAARGGAHRQGPAVS